MLEALKVLMQFRKHKQIKFSSRKSLENWQQQKLTQAKRHFARSFPFYKPYISEPFENWPLMNKDLFLANYKELNVLGLGLQEARDFAEEAESTRDFSQKISSYTIGISSGTSGKRTPFIVSPEERLSWAGAVLAKFLKTLFKRQKIAFVFRADSPLYQTVKSKVVQFKFFDLKSPFTDIICDLNTFCCDVLVAPATVLHRLAQQKKSGVCCFSPKRVISVAEVLIPESRKFIEEAFACPLSEVYQATEGFLASTCDHGRMHLHEESIYFEKRYLDREKKRFVPIITDFTRESQAFVRYELNDILHSSSEKCPCGSAAEVIEKIEGRTDDVFYLQDFLGQEQAVFPDFFRDIFSSCPAVGRYRLEQQASNSLVFYFEGKLSFQVKQELLKNFSELWKSLRVQTPQISFVECYSFPQDQKHRRIARLCSFERVSSSS